LVAHSLGNRVLLRALAHLLATHRVAPGVTHAILMAAAVSEGDCTPPGEFSKPYPSTRYVVLYSHSDRVLRDAFPIGQSLFGPRSSGQAVGFGGGPTSRWRDADSVETGLGHNGYWSSMHALRALDVAVGRLQPRPIAEGWNLAERSLPRRAVPT